MKRIIILLLVLSLSVTLSFAQEETPTEGALTDSTETNVENLEATEEEIPTEAIVVETKEEDTSVEDENDETDNESVSGSIVAGATIIDGKNYQHIGLRMDVPIGKFGFGVDAILVIDNDGNIRSEDWDEFEDYVDKIYYVRWAKKNDPFYLKVGGLDNSYIGYGAIVNGYSNMIEFPDYKRIGMETAFNTEIISGEFFLNNFKELMRDEPSMLFGTRVNYNVFNGLSIGVSAAMDLNEFNGLRDSDGDGYVDPLDDFPNDGSIVTERERLEELGLSGATIQELIEFGELNPATRDSLPKYADSTSTVSIVGFDIGYPFYKSEAVNIDLYAEFAKIVDYGFGFTAPGFRINSGVFTFTAAYRQGSEEFLFGYFNQTYELERAVFTSSTEDGLSVITKSETLRNIEAMKGYFAGVAIDFWGFLIFDINYQDLRGDNDSSSKSIAGSLGIMDKLIPLISTAEGYYLQNNVSDFSEWKTSSTTMGAIIGYEVSSGVSLDFNYKLTFVDKDGNGKIKGDNETIKSIGIMTVIRF